MVYKNKNINELLEKYWEGATSLEEEHILKDFFAQEEVPQAFRKVQPLFSYFRNQQNVAFEEPLAALENEQDEQVVIRMRPNPGRTIWAQLRPILQMAAAVVLIVGFSFVIWQQENQSSQKADLIQQDTFEDPEKAQATVEMALKFVSQKLNKGAQTATGGLKKVNKPFEIIQYE